MARIIPIGLHESVAKLIVPAYMMLCAIKKICYIPTIRVQWYCASNILDTHLYYYSQIPPKLCSQNILYILLRMYNTIFPARSLNTKSRLIDPLQRNHRLYKTSIYQMSHHYTSRPRYKPRIVRRFVSITCEAQNQKHDDPSIRHLHLPAVETGGRIRGWRRDLWISRAHRLRRRMAVECEGLRGLSGSSPERFEGTYSQKNYAVRIMYYIERTTTCR